MRKPRDPAWLPVLYDLADIEALRGVQSGTATAAQQAQALKWIVEIAAGTYEPSFRSDADGGERETAFAEGRRFVGLQIVKLLNMPPELVAKLRKENA